ncbi:helix-turn-helix domain-containing protein, partial [Ligilactobacillus ruminis]
AHGMYNLIKSDPYRKLVEQRKAELKSLIDHGATDAAIGAELGMTVSRVRYWIKEWNLGRRKHIITTGRFR